MSDRFRNVLHPGYFANTNTEKPCSGRADPRADPVPTGRSIVFHGPVDNASVEEREKVRVRVQSASAALAAQLDEGDEGGQRLAAEHLGDALAEYRRQVVTGEEQ